MYNYVFFARCLMTRKEAREQAFILLFQNTFKNEDFKELVETEKENGAYVEDEYCSSCVKTAIEHSEEITDLIVKYAKGWKIDRISKVAVSALRLAICEIKYFDDIPAAVSVNEAVELTKKYATEDDSSFVNGILGSVIRAED